MGDKDEEAEEKEEEKGVDVAFLSRPKCHDCSEHWLHTCEATETTSSKVMTQDPQLVS